MMATALAHAAHVKLDRSAATLELGFSPAQGFYRESLERPERAAALAEALRKVYDLDLNVRFERAERVPPQQPAVRVTKPEPVREASGSQAIEPEAEYVDEGALPLPPAPEGGDEETAAAMALDEDDETGLPAGAVAESAVVEELPPETADRKALDEEAAKHPLVKALLDKVGGYVVRVDRH
jgi:hypothetical protein